MNDFIEVTNRVIAEELKHRIKISTIEYSVIDGAFVIKVKYYTDEFYAKGFRFTHCPGILFDKDLLEDEFRCFIDREVF